MKPALPIALFAGAAALPAAPALAANPTTLFICRIGARTATVTADGPRLTYRFGRPGRPEIIITGGPNSGNAFYMRQRYVEWESQIRFTRGAHSYIVYTMPANAMAGSNAISGLVVLRGTSRIADHSCARQASFRYGYDYEGLPDDSEEFTAM
jgi:hypothetical protein